jgi:hypothetical protein
MRRLALVVAVIPVFFVLHELRVLLIIYVKMS